MGSERQSWWGRNAVLFTKPNSGRWRVLRPFNRSSEQVFGPVIIPGRGDERCGKSNATILAAKLRIGSALFLKYGRGFLIRVWAKTAETAGADLL
jgi:hypothetical protein